MSRFRYSIPALTLVKIRLQPLLTALALVLTGLLAAVPACAQNVSQGDSQGVSRNASGSQADELYLQKHYTQALPYYQSVIDTLKKNQKAAPVKGDRIVVDRAEANQAQVDMTALARAEDDLADCLCQTGDFARARAIYEAKLKALGLNGAAHKRLSYCTEIAGTYFRQDNYSEAEHYLNMAMALINETHLANDARANSSTLLAIYLGESLYRQNRYLDAIKVFQTALDGLQKSPTVSYEYSKMLLGSLAGSYDQLKQFDKSVPIYRAMAVLDRSYCGDTDLNYGWSLLELSDALKASGKLAEAAPLYKKAVWIFREDNCQRLAEKYGISARQLKEEEVDAQVSREKLEHDKKLSASLRRDIFGAGDNSQNKNGDKDLLPPGAALAALFDHCQAPPRGKLGAWNVKQTKQTEAPGWCWTDPKVEQKALMLCVPGLGLHHRAFQSFAERIVGQGFTVISFDVRGFGAYMQTKGYDHLDMHACVNDLISVIGLIKQDFPGKPIFLMGESMGGALALRVAAEQPDIIDGLVCSVPSGERHKETGTKFKIGLKFLTGANKPVDLAHSVVDKSIAANDYRERQNWLADPMARLKVSPRELIQFDLFMRQNKNYAAKICHTPVLIFQGMSDRLVKEAGTQSLFRALPTKDKALVLLGNQEHLIFEANPYKDDITLGIIGWLNAHAENQNACPTK